MILARVELDFRAPAGFGDEIEVGVRTGEARDEELRPPSTSCDAAKEVVANAFYAVLVAYDYESKSSKGDSGRMATTAVRPPAPLSVRTERGAWRTACGS